MGKTGLRDRESTGELSAEPEHPEATGPVSLTRGVVGHVAPHRVRPWPWPWPGAGPTLVHHPVHAVHAGAVRRARSHHALGHVRVAGRPGGEKDVH